MPVNLNPGFVYSVRPMSGSQITGSDVTPVRPTAQSRAAPSGMDAQVSARRSEEYVAALRELKAQEAHTRRDLASRTYLDIAHYEGNVHLVDTYT